VAGTERSGLFNFENEPVWLIHDSNSFFLIVLIERCRLLEILGLEGKVASRCDAASAEALALSLNVKQLYDSNLRVCCQFLITPY
jgi:hypothetical protein